MSLSYPVNLNDFIEDVKTYNTDHSLSTDVSGILIFHVTNNGSPINSWDIEDSDASPIYNATDISDASLTSAYFLPYSGIITLKYNKNADSPTDSLDFYVIPSDSMSSFSSPRVNINSLTPSLINTNVVYRIFQNYMLAPSSNLIDPIIYTPPATAETFTTATLPIISSYTPAQVNSLFDTRDTGLRVVETKSEQTIAAEVKNYLNTNGALPQFKNYGDYIAYKNAINLQNGLLQRYG
jgi:hypothetical protein